MQESFPRYLPKSPIFLRKAMQKFIQKLKLKNRHGAILILAMFIMVALSLLTLTSFELLTGSIRISRNHKDDLQALYVAEAGIEEGVKRMREYGTCSSFAESWSGCQYTVTVDSSVSSYLTFTSVGSVGYFQRTLEAQVKVVATPEFPNPHKYSVAVMYWKEKEM